jgi:hypothetical protein
MIRLRRRLGKQVGDAQQQAKDQLKKYANSTCGSSRIGLHTPEQ